ncbi:hypothetical protein I5Q40_22335 [Serratia marcescens]|nr:hypothetical protein [Serratia marcescens]
MVQRYNPDYVMHAARFAPLAREAEHGEFVKFSDYEALVSELASSRQINAQTLQVKLTMAETIKELTDRVNALAEENAALNESAADLRRQAFNGRRNSHNCGPFQYSDLCESIIEATKAETPATDAALAAIQAQGVEKAASALDALSAQSASATTQANFRAAAVYLRTTVLPAIGEAK